MAFTEKLEHEDGTPADPPTIRVAVPTWNPGNTISLAPTGRYAGSRFVARMRISRLCWSLRNEPTPAAERITAAWTGSLDPVTMGRPCCSRYYRRVPCAVRGRTDASPQGASAWVPSAHSSRCRRRL
jgi:hypothetical protein